MNERLIMKGKLVELEEQASILSIKIKGTAKIVRESCNPSTGSYEQMDDQTIKVFSSELVKDICSLREIKEKMDFLKKEIDPDIVS